MIMGCSVPTNAAALEPGRILGGAAVAGPGTASLLMSRQGGDCPFHAKAVSQCVLSSPKPAAPFRPDDAQQLIAVCRLKQVPPCFKGGTPLGQGAGGAERTCRHRHATSRIASHELGRGTDSPQHQRYSTAPLLVSGDNGFSEVNDAFRCLDMREVDMLAFEVDRAASIRLRRPERVDHPSVVLHCLG